MVQMTSGMISILSTGDLIYYRVMNYGKKTVISDVFHSFRQLLTKIRENN